MRVIVAAGLDRKEAELFSQLNPNQLPKHIAIIMDGNGRWAKRRHLPRIAGHKRGVESVRYVTETAARIGLPGGAAPNITLARRVLTRLYAWSFRRVIDFPCTDGTNGFRAFNRKALESIAMTQDRMAHASEIVHEIARLNLRWKEVPVRISYTEYSRRKGQSSLGAIDILLDLIFAKR